MVTPKPMQYPHPPAWMACASENSAAVAGKAGMGMLSFSIMQPLEAMGRHIRNYRAAAENPEPITDVTTNATAAYTLVHCAETPQQVLDNEVWKSVEWWYTNLAQFTLDWELPELSQEERDATFPLLKPLMEDGIDDLIHHFDEADMIVVGDVDTCYEKMKHYADLGVDQLICYVQFGYHSHESIMRTIELLGKEIIPELEKYEPTPTTS